MGLTVVDLKADRYKRQATASGVDSACIGRGVSISRLSLMQGYA
jgi:hypothetical protein